MTNEKNKLTDADLEGASGAGPGISSQKAAGRGGMSTADGGSEHSTASGTSPGGETTPGRRALGDHEEPK